MNCLIAYDSFKDSISSTELGNQTNTTIKQLLKNDRENMILTISDGGEGLLESLKVSLNLEFTEVTSVIGPLGNTITSKYAHTSSSNSNENERFAVIEMAMTSGIEMVPVNQRSPMNTTTYGVGQLIDHAVTVGGYKKIYIGAGGSATNDAGLGALQSVGLTFTFFNPTLTPSYIYGRDLSNISSIQVPKEIQNLYNDVEFIFLTDVQNPFIGVNGAVACFSKQKGATESDQLILEQSMTRITKTIYPRDISTVPGSGAAGGLASGFISYFNAKVEKGIDFVLSHYHLSEKLEKKQIDMIITGEGCFDSTTLNGKVVSKIMNISSEYNIPLMIICGKKNISTDIEKEIFDKFQGKCVIYDLVSEFGERESLNNTKHCIDSLIKKVLLKFLQSNNIPF
ncbi:hypothetical protein DLAC_10946 [Tieghemostelium lacteum]|uniref:Glycerate kinase n=1 Tax=Tieghemostelium lacteum TaxID=361077 RepID=A0A151Z2S0_TIELA|nr:hypothetical protein DLAC_10946 [Tieghemostelium lacteum]|eukprot:KYQ88255.1 hypothetical protein DLAC_10946 [Tieghemostelium lacteum]